MKIQLTPTFPFVRFAHSVDSVIASFQLQSVRLRTLVDHHNAQRDTLYDVAVATHAAAVAHENEAGRATKIARNIENLIAA